MRESKRARERAHEGGSEGESEGGREGAREGAREEGSEGAREAGSCTRAVPQSVQPLPVILGPVRQSYLACRGRRSCSVAPVTPRTPFTPYIRYPCYTRTHLPNPHTHTRRSVYTCVRVCVYVYTPDGRAYGDRPACAHAACTHCTQTAYTVEVIGGSC